MPEGHTLADGLAEADFASDVAHPPITAADVVPWEPMSASRPSSLRPYTNATCISDQRADWREMSVPAAAGHRRAGGKTNR